MQYDLVLEGGGAKGIVFVGAMQALEAKNIVPSRLLGTSAGAITATLLAAGYSSQELFVHINEMEAGKPIFTTFMQTPANFTDEEIAQSVLQAFFEGIDLPFVPEAIEQKLDRAMMKALMKNPLYRHLFSFIERGGWFSADRFVEWLASKLDFGTFRGQPRHFSQMSFSEFRAATGVDLTLIGSDITAKRVLVLNHITAPDCPVVWAARMSMSVPLLWQEVIWRAEWGLYRGRDMAGHVVVDGGLLSNFPIELLISNSPKVTAVMGEKQTDNVLGLLIDEKLGAPGLADPDKKDGGGGILEGVKTVRRLSQLVETMVQAHDKMVMDEFEHLVVNLPARGVGITEFDLSESRKAALVQAGRVAMEAYLESAGVVGKSIFFEEANMMLKAETSALRFLDE